MRMSGSYASDRNPASPMPLPPPAMLALPRKLQPHLAIALGIVAPVFAHLHEQEQMHLLFQHFANLLARGLPDRLDRLALVAEQDLLLAVALQIDHLL